MSSNQAVVFDNPIVGRAPIESFGAPQPKTVKEILAHYDREWGWAGLR